MTKNKEILEIFSRIMSSGSSSPVKIAAIHWLVLLIFWWKKEGNSQVRSDLTSLFCCCHFTNFFFLLWIVLWVLCTFFYNWTKWRENRRKISEHTNFDSLTEIKCTAEIYYRTMTVIWISLIRMVVLILLIVH